MAGLLAPLSSQEPLVIHLYVDPIYGDDGVVNQEFNPDGAGTECAGASIVGPHSVVDATLAPLQHAPYPFKTITQAINAINQLSAAPGQRPLPHTDPATGNTWSYCIIHLLPGWYGTNDPVNIRNESLDPATLTHRVSRLVPNGETFPLHIPPRVSLVGTSALNTVIDTGQVGTAIEFGVLDGNQVPLTGEGTYLDKITFFACGGRINNPGGLAMPEPDPRRCAAILIDDHVGSRPTITNCVFLKNAIGVLISTSESFGMHGQPVPANLAHDGTTIVNCTFAWNMIGLWNGQIDEPTQSVGLSKLNLINNIFDGSETITQAIPCDSSNATAAFASWPNYAIGGAGLQLSGIASAFEGVSQEDLRTLVAGVPVDFNAYEQGIDNTSGLALENYNARLPTTGIAVNLPLTQPRVATPFVPDPSRNIAPFTAWPNQTNAIPVTRGILYVTDLICRGQTVGAFPAGPVFDGSWHDLRLSPIAVPAPYVPGLPPANAQLHPLVDSGFRGPFPATMENGQTLPFLPGFLPLSPQTAWLHHAWEADAEGYGNPRIHNHPAYADTPQVAAADAGMDIGADELGELVIAGYRFGTTNFLRLPQADPDNSTPNDIDNSNLFYLGPTSALGLAPIAVPQPDYRDLQNFLSAIVGYTYPAAYGTRTWHSAETNDPTIPASVSRPYFAIRNQLFVPTRVQPPPIIPPPVTPTGNPLNDFMQAVRNVGQGYRATAADTTPALLPDVHPWWMDLPPLLLGSLETFGLSPLLAIWQDPGNCVGGNYFLNNGQLPTHNNFLYQDPLVHDLNPPGAGLGFSAGGQQYVWLDGTPSFNGLGQPLLPPAAAGFDNWSAVPLVLSDYDVWCRGGTGGAPGALANRSVPLPPTTVTSVTNAVALRFTVEWSDANVPWVLPGPGPLRQKNMQSFTVVIQ